MDTTTSRPPLLFEAAAQWLVSKTKENRLPLLSSLALGLLGYTFAFTNKFLNHDEVTSLFSKGATVDSGRWGLGALDSIFPNYSMPWIYGILTIALMAVACTVMIHVFDLRSKPLQVLLCGSVILFPSLIGTFAFMFTSSSYGLSFLLSVLAVWFVCQKDRKLWLPGLACMILSLSIYQSYIAISASMLVLVLIRQLLHGEALAPVIKRGFLYVGFLVVSLGLYYAATQLVLILKDAEFNDYASDRVIFSLATLLDGVRLAYTHFFQTFTQLRHRLIPTEFSRTVHYICLAGAALLLVLWALAQEKKEPGRFLLLAALIAVLPLAVNCMFLFTAEDAIHTLVLYGFVAVYLLLIIVAEACIPLYFSGKAPEWLRRVLADVVAFGLAVIVMVNIYVANTSYLALHLQYETTYAFYTSLLADIKMMPEFTEGTKLAVIGTWQYPEYYDDHFEYTRSLTGLYSFGPDLYSKEKFLEYYLGIDLPVVSQSTVDKIKETPEFAEMAVYPYYGSLKLIDNVLVVKLSQ